MLQEGRIDDVIRQSREQIRKDPRDAAGHFMLAQALVRKGATPGEPAMAEAQASLQKAVQLSPQFDQARALLGKLYFDSGKHALAVKELEAALQIKPGNRVAIYQLMLAYGAAGVRADACGVCRAH
jgi:cytochrome c-type biogenesis protein CcmH/NrfG